MNDQNLFSQSDQTDLSPNTDVDFVAELTGPGKKFDMSKYPDAEAILKHPLFQDVAKGKYLADHTLDFKIKEFDKLAEDFTKERQNALTGQRLQELLDKYDQLGNQPQSDHTPQAPTEKPTIDPNEIENLFDRKFQERELQRKRTENYNLVVNKAKERFGNNYETRLREQMKELDMSPEEANALARSNPKTFNRLFGLDQEPQTEGFQTPPRSDARSDNFSPKHTLRTWSYYQQLRKDKPDLYYTPKIQSQMLRDADTLGTKFQDGSWNAY